MIPKIIHYCWFGGKDKPEDVLSYIESWKKQCPDYRIKEWNENNFDINKIAFTREAYKCRRFAFVSDVARLYALYNEGGIYLDTDVKLLKPLDSLLNTESFIGYETPYLISTAVIGCGEKCDWVQHFYNEYTRRHFIRLKGSLDLVPNTVKLTNFLHMSYPKYKEIHLLNNDVLCAKYFNGKDYFITDDTIAVHDFSGTWLNERLTVFKRLENLCYRFL